MTDIDAIRKRHEAHIAQPYTSYQQVHEDRRALLAAYDAKCEELATSEREFQAMFKAAVKYKEERDAAVRDAQRYRWLRYGVNDEAVMRTFEGNGARKFDSTVDRCWLLRNESLDAAIDSQLAALAPPTEQPKVGP